MNININIGMYNFTICPYCFGTGELKVMQLAKTHNGDTIRYKDTCTKCEKCKGRGVISNG